MNVAALNKVVEVRTYRTTDAKVFNEKGDADKHQFDLDHKEQIWWTPSNLRCEAQYDNHTLNAKPMSTHDLARLLLDNPDLPAVTPQLMKIDRVVTFAQNGKEYARIGERPNEDT